MDISTIIGIVLSFSMILMGILLGGELGLFIDPPSTAIVIGGTTATLFSRYPINTVFTIITVIKKTIFNAVPDPSEVITQFVQLSQIARKEGLLALERVQFEDPFLAKGINFCVDGAEGHQIEAIMAREIQYIKARHQAGGNMLKALEISAPAFGMIGTLVGLVNMLGALEDPAAIGPAMAVALLTTLYGAIIANVFFAPIAKKLKIYSKEESLNKRMIIEGIMAIQQGDNPRIVERKLAVFLPPSMRGSGE